MASKKVDRFCMLFPFAKMVKKQKVKVAQVKRLETNSTVTIQVDAIKMVFVPYVLTYEQTFRSFDGDVSFE